MPPAPAAAAEAPVNTRDTALPGYRAALAAHQSVAPAQRVDPGLSEAVERQTRAMRELSQRAFPAPNTASDNQPGPDRGGPQPALPRIRGHPGSCTALHRAPGGVCRPADRHVGRCCRACPAAYDGVSPSIVCEANAASGTTSWDEGWGFVRGDTRQIQTAVLDGADSEEPLVLPLEAIELDASRRRRPDPAPARGPALAPRVATGCRLAPVC